MTELARQRDLVRELARQVVEIAHEPRMTGILQRWKDVNGLRRPDRAPVWCRPVGCWKEIIPEDALVCGDPWLRSMEYGFRQVLYKREIGDDTPVEPHFTVSAAFDVTPPNVWGVDIRRHGTDVAGGAWAYDAALKTEADFDRLRLPQFSYNAQKTDERLQRMDELLGDIAPVKLAVGAPLTATLGHVAADLRGLEQMMVDMVDQPDLLHRLMSYLRDAVLAALDAVEATGLVTPGDTGPMTAIDSFGPDPGESGHTFKNCWCMANSQEFDQVSPPMWEEFLLAYQRPIFERFGLVGYGCCENLTHKIDGVLGIPNLRIFTCSAWTDLDAVIDKVGTRHCIMWRQKASDVVYSDERQLREDLHDGARRLQGHYYQVVLRELQTLASNPDRLHVWTRLATEAAEKYA